MWILQSWISSDPLFHLRLQDDSAEVAVWGCHDCWVIGQCQAGKRLYVVLEHQGKEGLTDACKSVDAFAQHHFPGAFE